MNTTRPTIQIVAKRSSGAGPVDDCFLADALVRFVAAER
jgi:hypothetical protein